MKDIKQKLTDSLNTLTSSSTSQDNLIIDILTTAKDIKNAESEIGKNSEIETKDLKLIGMIETGLGEFLKKNFGNTDLDSRELFNEFLNVNLKINAFCFNWRNFVTSKF